MLLSKLVGRKPEAKANGKLLGPFDEDNAVIPLDTTFSQLKCNQLCYGTSWERWTVQDAAADIKFFMIESAAADDLNPVGTEIGKNTMKIYLPGGNQAIFTIDPKRAILFYLERMCDMRHLPLGLPLKDSKSNEIPKNTTCEAMKAREAWYGTDILEWVMISEFSKGNKLVRHLTPDVKPGVLDRLQFIDDLRGHNALKKREKESQQTAASNAESVLRKKKSLTRNSHGTIKEHKNNSPSTVSTMKELFSGSQAKVKTPRSGQQTPPGTLGRVTRQPIVPKTSYKKLQFAPIETKEHKNPGSNRRLWHNQKNCHLTDIQLLEKYLGREARYNPNFASPFRFESSERVEEDPVDSFDWSSDTSSGEQWRTETQSKFKIKEEKETQMLKNRQKGELKEEKESRDKDRDHGHGHDAVSHVGSTKSGGGGDGSHPNKTRQPLTLRSKSRGERDNGTLAHENPYTHSRGKNY